MAKVRKKFNRVKQLNRVADSVMRNILICYTDTIGSCVFYDKKGGYVVKPTDLMIASASRPHQWSVYLATFGRTLVDEYFKGEQVFTSSQPRIQRGRQFRACGGNGYLHDLSFQVTETACVRCLPSDCLQSAEGRSKKCAAFKVQPVSICHCSEIRCFTHLRGRTGDWTGLRRCSRNPDNSLHSAIGYPPETTVRPPLAILPETEHHASHPRITKTPRQTSPHCPPFPPGRESIGTRH